MKITDQDLADLAAESVAHAIGKLADNAMGLHEELAGEFDEFDSLDIDKQDRLIEELERAVRRYLPVQVFDVESGGFRPAQED